MEDTTASRIRRHPEFNELVRRRNKFAWTLAIVMLGIYYGFILVIAFAPGILAIPLASGAVTTVGIPVGILIILSAFVLTGIYVRRANSEFDEINRRILEGTRS